MMIQLQCGDCVMLGLWWNGSVIWATDFAEGNLG